MTEPVDPLVARSAEVGIDRAVWEEYERQEAEKQAKVDALLPREAD